MSLRSRDLIKSKVKPAALDLPLGRMFFMHNKKEALGHNIKAKDVPSGEFNLNV